MKNVHKARKEWKCCGCSKKIEKGTIYYRRSKLIYCFNCIGLMTFIDYNAIKDEIYIYYMVHYQEHLKIHEEILRMVDPTLRRFLIGRNLVI